MLQFMMGSSTCYRNMGFMCTEMRHGNEYMTRLAFQQTSASVCFSDNNVYTQGHPAAMR